MTADVPEEFLPDELMILADAPECPGCSQTLKGALREYEAVDYEGATWCRECAFRDSDAVLEADDELLCLSCYLPTPFRRAAAPGDAVCHGCGAKFRVERAEEKP